jgi:RimJ/RimL family protein N-acetyltransferase
MEIKKYYNFIKESFQVKKSSINLASSKLYDIYVNNNKVGQIILSDDEYDYINIPEDLGTDNLLYLSFIIIDEEYRNKGYFKKAINWLIKYAEKTYDYIVIRIDTDSDVDFYTLKSIYQNLGFKPFTPEDISEFKYSFNYVEEEDNFMFYKL